MFRSLKFMAISCFGILLTSARPAAAMDALTQELVDRLAHQPELMNMRYLEQRLGAPANNRTQRTGESKSFYWYEKNYALAGHMKAKYELHQEEEYPGRLTDSTFTVYLHGPDLAVADMAKYYGQTGKFFYDYNSTPTTAYSFAPNTSLLFLTPPSQLFVSTIKVIYHGPALPLPSPTDLDEAELRHEEEPSKLMAVGNLEAAIPHLEARLKKNPNDAECHYLLAQAYRHTGHINDAINQYKLGLYYGSQYQDLQTRCIAGLGELRNVDLNKINQPRPEQVVPGNQQYNGQSMLAGKTPNGMAPSGSGSGYNPAFPPGYVAPDAPPPVYSATVGTPPL